jgi:predicted RNase H-like nuclease (RuvC/YqgF family)
MDISTIIISLMVAVIASIPGIAALIAGRKKISAEAEKYETEADKLRLESGDIVRKAAQELAAQYKTQNEELEGIIIKLKAQVSDLREELRDAYVEIRRLNEALKLANRKLSE